jgi:cell division transport system permease protein
VTKKRYPSGGQSREPRATATTADTAPVLERIESYLLLHAHTMVASLGRMYRKPVSTAMTVLVIAIALALPASFQILVHNAREAGGNLEATNEISVFLKPELSNEVGRKIAEKLREHPQIERVRLITKEAGLKEFQNYSGFGEALEALNFNPLPAVISIKPKDSLEHPEDAEKLLSELKKRPETDFVQLDTEWMRKLHAMLAIAQRSVGVFGALLSLAVLFIVGNTIRLELQNRQEEIAVTKLMGATNGFIRRPFLYTGLWYGLLGGVIAWLLVTFLLLLLRGPVHRLAELYGGGYELGFLSAPESFFLIALSSAMGVIGSLAVVSYHLRRLEPGTR